MKRILLLASSIFMLVSCSDKGAVQSRADWIADQMRDPASTHVVVIAHRGDWRNFPENSIPSINSVIEMGADVMELDLKMTRDSVLVLSHDRTIDRCTDGSGNVSDYTYEELLQFHLKDSYGNMVDTLHMTTLRDAFLACKDRICVNVDQGYAFYDQVLALAEELGVTDQILIKSSIPWSRSNETMSKHEHNMMFMPIINLWQPQKVEWLDEYLEEGRVPMAFEICFRQWDDGMFEDYASRIIAAGSKVWVNTLWPSISGGPGTDDATAWGGETPDPDSVYGPLLEHGVSMIQTDNAAELLGWLRAQGRHD